MYSHICAADECVRSICIYKYINLCHRYSTHTQKLIFHLHIINILMTNNRARAFPNEYKNGAVIQTRRKFDIESLVVLFVNSYNFILSIKEKLSTKMIDEKCKYSFAYLALACTIKI